MKFNSASADPNLIPSYSGITGFSLTVYLAIGSFLRKCGLGSITVALLLSTNRLLP